MDPNLEFRRNNQSRTCVSKNPSGTSGGSMTGRELGIFTLPKDVSRRCNSAGLKEEQVLAGADRTEETTIVADRTLFRSSTRTPRPHGHVSSELNSHFVGSDATVRHCLFALSLQREEVVVELVSQVRNRKDANLLSQNFQVLFCVVARESPGRDQSVLSTCGRSLGLRLCSHSCFLCTIRVG